MKFKIFKTTKREQCFKLEQADDGIKLITVDQNGNSFPGGAILSISEKGIYLFTGVSDKLGLPLDRINRVKTRSN